MNDEKGKWIYALNDMIFDIVCEFGFSGIATEDDGLAQYGSDPAIFIPDDIYNQTTAKRACKNRGGALFDPQSYTQRKNTLGRGLLVLVSL